MSLPRIIIFASGNGSNAVNIIQYFNEKKNALVPAVFYNKKDAGVVTRVKDKNIDLHYFNRTDFYDTENVIEAVRKHKPDLIVLAGFLWLVPASFIKAFENKIINLHPSLLPKYGGKGMYGHFVHEAVLNSGDRESGITIHKVNSEFDKGEILFQAKCPIIPEDTVESLAAKIHQLEHRFLPGIISDLVSKK